VKRPIALLLGAVALLGLSSAARAGSELDQRHTLAAGSLPAIGLLTIGNTHCTGFLAGTDRAVVTAAHCVFKRDGQITQERIDFLPNYRAGTSAGVYRARVIATGGYHPPANQQEADQSTADDWAILLTEKPTGILPLPLMSDTPLSLLADKPVAAVGYSADLENGRFLTEDTACSVIRAQDLRIDHGCRGSDGGPLFLLNDDGSRGPIIGVITSSALTSPSERLVISNLLALARVRGMPEVDFGGHAAFVGAFLNATKVMAANR